MRWVRVIAALSTTILAIACESLLGVEAVTYTNEAGADGDEATSDALPPEECPPEPTIFQGDVAPNADCIPCGDAGSPSCVLGDPLNCGWCGHRCPDQTTCVAGVCDTSTLTASLSAMGILFETTSTYHVWATGTSLLRIPIDGGAQTPLVDLGPNTSQIQSVADDGDYSFIRTVNEVYRVPLLGGDASLLTPAMLGGGASMSLLGDSFVVPSNPNVLRFLKDGGGPIVLASRESNPDWVAVLASPTRVFWTTAEFADGGAVPEAGAIHFSDTTGVHHLVDGLTEPRRLVSDGSFFYYAEKADGTLWRIPVAGGRAQLLAQSPPPFPFIHALVMDKRYLYFIGGPARDANAEPGALYRISKCPGFAPAILARDVRETPASYAGTTLTEDANYVYWSYDRFIARAAK